MGISIIIVVPTTLQAFDSMGVRQKSFVPVQKPDTTCSHISIWPSTQGTSDLLGQVSKSMMTTLPKIS